MIEVFATPLIAEDPVNYFKPLGLIQTNQIKLVRPYDGANCRAELYRGGPLSYDVVYIRHSYEEVNHRPLRVRGLREEKWRGFH
jgi:hypothetical protein